RDGRRGTPAGRCHVRRDAATDPPTNSRSAGPPTGPPAPAWAPAEQAGAWRAWAPWAGLGGPRNPPLAGARRTAGRRPGGRRALRWASRCPACYRPGRYPARWPPPRRSRAGARPTSGSWSRDRTAPEREQRGTTRGPCQPEGRLGDGGSPGASCSHYTLATPGRARLELPPWPCPPLLSGWCMVAGTWPGKLEG